MLEYLACRLSLDFFRCFVWLRGLKIGFFGLGVMGQAIVPRLVAAGHTVTGWNRTKVKAAHLLQLGMHWSAAYGR